MSDDMQVFEIKLSNIEKDVSYIKKFIDDDREKYNEHVESSQGFRDKVITHENQIDGIKNELTLLKWMLGIIITVGLALLGKLLNIF
jgi:hypothetical protein